MFCFTRTKVRRKAQPNVIPFAVKIAIFSVFAVSGMLSGSLAGQFLQVLRQFVQEYKSRRQVPFVEPVGGNHLEIRPLIRPQKYIGP